MDLDFAKTPDKWYMIRFNRLFRNSNGKSEWTTKYSTANVWKLGQDRNNLCQACMTKFDRRKWT